MVDLHRPGLPNNPKTLKPAIPPLKAPPAASAALQAAKQRAKTLLAKLPGNSPSKSNPLLAQYLETLMSDTAEGAALKSDLTSRAREEFERHKRLAGQLCEFLRPLQSRQVQLQFMREVLYPAQRGQLSSQDSANHFNRVRNSKTPILEVIEHLFGPLMLTVGCGAEAGAGLGIEGAVGLAFARHSPVALVRGATLAAGAYAEGTTSISAGVSRGPPAAGESLTMDVSVSAASGISGEFLISLTPVLHAPTLLPEKHSADLRNAKSFDDVLDATTRQIYGATVYSGFVVDYEYAGYSASIGVGAGLGGAIGFTVSRTSLLPGFLV